MTIINRKRSLVFPLWFAKHLDLQLSPLIKRALVCLIVSTGMAQSGWAQPYPANPIRIVAPFGVGGGGDTSLRILGQQLTLELGQPVIIDNRPGANGIIGAQEVLRSPADGYTLFYGSTTTLAANTSLMKTLPYDPLKDFAPITRVGLLPFVLVVTPALPVHSVRELIAYAKAHPGKLSYASANATGQVAGSTFAQMAGIDMLNVPYKTNAAGLTDVMNGTISVMFADVPSALVQVEAGRMRALGVTTAQRSAILPQLPSIAESGLPGYEVVAWTAMCVRAGTNPAIVKQLNAAIIKALDNPELRAKFAKIGIDVALSSPIELSTFIRTEKGKWATLIHAAGIQPE
ncbi:tripartite tricarboxylate transporter substrate binding protein [Glaciimonas sp. Gout2]|uniref:Bug family tripartite tricarboxylate transporter substrate binding protein n=1 Tax=unclassified Glaciimonas TaxID=2644401 RepID=UPI002B23DE60|nr:MULTISPECIES: tripartite tricarboxylate transporter substrate binding protein [unclassified Glaciimonas]MEB0011306.1 tripartite tricarboxylate transporter substrate binding protein [Glaciimonas sp. Cout2]MEB0080956.1 tripartite tricarboxylate transporter substrate binding protein [Glaciimonas sp. Gout2]